VTRSVSPAATGNATRLTTLAAIFIAALALRMVVPMFWPGIHYPDEVMQSLEQAHRLVFGNGLVPWEFRDGARSWLLPALLAAPMWLGDVLAPETNAYRLLAQALVAALSASTVVIGFVWGRKHGLRHAVVAAVALCTWFELVYFGARALGEVVAAAFLFAGVYLCAAREPCSTRHDVLAGVCLAGAFVFRFHLAPALALAALWRCRTEIHARWSPMLLGAAIPLLALGIADGIAWSEPFASIVNNFRANILQGRSHVYGTSGVGWYVLQLVERWRYALPVVVLLALRGARREPLPLLVAVTVVLVHSAIAHKEYRFIYPALPLIVFCASLGTADLLHWLQQRRAGRAVSRAGLPVACAAWLVSSLALAVAPTMRPEWTRGRAGVELMSRAGREARCGVGLLVGWSWTGGYSSLHRNLPLYLLDWERERWNTQAFDAWILPQGVLDPRRAGYRRVQCEVQGAAGVEALCLWIRRDGCDAAGATNEAQHVLDTTGQ
jgi:GPI mannosyltransferase 3